MYCLVDFRNRPQYKYTFPKIEKARECLQKIKNNPLGVTVIFSDGRREYFENGLPHGFFTSSKKITAIKKGCHSKYRIREMGNLDGVLKKKHQTEATSAANWQKKSILPLFMLGNWKFYTSLAVAALFIFYSSFYFQRQSGQSVSAQLPEIYQPEGQVAGAMDVKAENDGNEDSLKLADEEIVMNLLGKIEELKEDEFESEILKYVKGRPMEDMAPYIAKQPRIVAAFLVGIAMKESKFGTYSPKLGGQDCHNYWGFKGGGTTTSGGYTCFSSPGEAIQIVGKRLAKLVEGGRTNPSAMVIWKCGSTCSWDNPENVRKWIADVGVNFYKINSKESS
ncbi:MAG: hypothetical protein A2359_03380 [Candidatus Moranbacteria bacterium RIFOXYB1_FULL_43_19]|nr:MAG: hypothetical protein A2359_03380 [Candidatus Moranbacteria bacterium RIFOXYB1_FULL_43_19]OGI32547.1 MAG: hypothetical protein A2420_03155 [Candidatus Moranbacteria bacterium RIFOXYC1_FULL_44_13]OGI38182.1 MAG: hypothetical protein A2612_02900 [Candidatus Moranbacteria bacterium RIFOXYD1_FULL_44_12]